MKSTLLKLDADSYPQRIFLTHSACINPHLQTIAAHVCRRFACCRSLCNCRILTDQNWGFRLRLIILQTFYESNLQYQYRYMWKNTSVLHRFFFTVHDANTSRHNRSFATFHQRIPVSRRHQLADAELFAACCPRESFDFRVQILKKKYWKTLNAKSTILNL